MAARKADVGEPQHAEEGGCKEQSRGTCSPFSATLILKASLRCLDGLGLPYKWETKTTWSGCRRKVRMSLEKKVSRFCLEEARSEKWQWALEPRYSFRIAQHEAIWHAPQRCPLPASNMENTRAQKKATKKMQEHLRTKTICHLLQMKHRREKSVHSLSFVYQMYRKLVCGEP